MLVIRRLRVMVIAGSSEQRWSLRRFRHYIGVIIGVVGVAVATIAKLLVRARGQRPWSRVESTHRTTLR